MGKLSRDKGRKGELEVVKILNANGFPKAKRNAEAQADDGGVDIVGVGFWAVEVKRAKQARQSDVQRWWQEAVQQAWARADATDVYVEPVLFYRIDGCGSGLPLEDKWMAMMSATGMCECLQVSEEHVVLMRMSAWLDIFGKLTRGWRDAVRDV